MRKDFKLRTEEGAYDLEAQVHFAGADLVVTIGGGKAHVGAVAVAQPRPSLEDPERRSATASVICLLGHKEDAVAKDAAETLAAALDVRVVVTAGMHWDGIDPTGLRQVVRNGELLVEAILRKVLSPGPK